MRTQLSRGFTLIELLVVIGILGILAGTLFFTINPIEQLNRGGDAAKKTAAESFATAMSAYYSTNSSYPFGATPCPNPAVDTASALYTTTVNGCVTLLISQGELRNTFDDDTSILSTLFLTRKLSGTVPGFSICFPPVSNSEIAAANYNQTGGSWSTGTKYWCIVQ